MSHTYYIQDRKEMPARDGKKFATVYYKATKAENDKLFEYVSNILKGVQQDLEEALMYKDYTATNVYSSALPGRHKHLSGEPYTMVEVMMDLYNQLKDGKDPTESLINRWNVVFEDKGITDGIIAIKNGTRPPIGKFKLKEDLFE